MENRSRGNSVQKETEMTNRSEGTLCRRKQRWKTGKEGIPSKRRGMIYVHSP